MNRSTDVGLSRMDRFSQTGAGWSHQEGLSSWSLREISALRPLMAEGCCSFFKVIFLESAESQVTCDRPK